MRSGVQTILQARPSRRPTAAQTEAVHGLRARQEPTTQARQQTSATSNAMTGITTKAVHAYHRLTGFIHVQESPQTLSGHTPTVTARVTHRVGTVRLGHRLHPRQLKAMRQVQQNAITSAKTTTIMAQLARLIPGLSHAPDFLKTHSGTL